MKPRIGDLVRGHVKRMHERRNTIRIGNLVRGHYFHKKIGIVIQIDEKAEMAFVQYTDNKRAWEPIVNLREAIA